ncbi:hypothetical protein ACTXI9_01620 [Brachybacterium alimentarium]|uniref:hypothetical protein n=1 Tax=Brachybacterium alimentarium TaxID=47845 RepID=UPI003FD0E054
MSITRPHMKFEDHYTQLPNRWVRDGRLTLKARGLLAQLFSHRAGWRVNVAALVDANPEGRDAIRGAILELETHGYLTRTQNVDDESGKFGGVEYVLTDPWSDSPTTEKPSPVSSAESQDHPRSEPTSGYPTTGDPTSVNPPYKKTISKEDQEKNIVDEPGQRDDVEAVCAALAAHVVGITGKKPTIGKTWRRDVRLMLDRDEHSMEQILAAVAWVAGHGFWAGNILSPGKLRTQWWTLSAQASRDQGPKLDRAAETLLRDRQRRQQVAASAPMELTR